MITIPFYQNFINLTPREMQIMNILWETDEPLLASQVAVISGLSINTVNAVVKKMLKNDLLEVADIIYSGTVLSRRYQPTVSRQEYATNVFVGQLGNGSKLPTPQIVARLLDREDNEEETLSELQEMINERKKKLQEDK